MAPFERAFVGDEVHRFAPGNVVLVGPRLPHNFEFIDALAKGNQAPSPVLRFADVPLRQGMDLLPDLREAEPLLDRAQQGIEFVGIRDLVIGNMLQIKDSQGLERFSAFSALLHKLACWKDYRSLATWKYRKGGMSEDARSGTMYIVLDYLRVNYM